MSDCPAASDLFNKYPEYMSQYGQSVPDDLVGSGNCTTDALNSTNCGVQCVGGTTPNGLNTFDNQQSYSIICNNTHDVNFRNKVATYKRIQNAATVWDNIDKTACFRKCPHIDPSNDPDNDKRDVNCYGKQPMQLALEGGWRPLTTDGIPDGYGNVAGFTTRLHGPAGAGAHGPRPAALIYPPWDQDECETNECLPGYKERVKGAATGKCKYNRTTDPHTAQWDLVDCVPDDSVSPTTPGGGGGGPGQYTGGYVPPGVPAVQGSCGDPTG